MNDAPSPLRTPDPNDPVDALKLHAAGMADLAVGMVQDGTRALLLNDRALADSVVSRDTPLDRFDVAIETESIRLMATLQPEAEDLRTIGAVLKIANCIDRVGRLGFDLAKNITAAPEPADKTPSEDLRKMEEKGRAMVRQAVQAFLTDDAPLAKEVFALDDDVDDLYEELEKNIFAQLRVGGPSTERLGRYLLAGRHLERVADNACKIAEKAIYAITGERRPEYFPALAHRATTGVRPTGHTH